MTYPALVTETIRADTVFVPYHWAGAASANLLTVDALHPISKIPEYKVCACRIERGDAVTPAPPPPLAPGQAEDAVAARAAADDRPAVGDAGEGDRRRMMNRTLFIDPGRCIGCQACVAACRECDSHRGKSMIHLDYLEEGATAASMPTVCMHCEDPVAPCAQVCPTDAILVTTDGVVQEAAKERCIGCANCVHACPFGVPKLDVDEMLMYKCNLCYDRTSEGLDPMCASVCPTGSIFYGTLEELLGVPAERRGQRHRGVRRGGGPHRRRGRRAGEAGREPAAVPGGFAP